MIGKFKTGPPAPPLTPIGVLTWARELIAWLKSEESESELTVEEQLVLGGPDVASRLFGFEGTLAAPGAGDEAEILAGPTAPESGKKKILVSISISGEAAAAGAGEEVRLFKLMPGPVEHDLAVVLLKKDDGYLGHVNTFKTLDAVGESFRIEAVAGGASIHWDGTYLAVD